MKNLNLFLADAKEFLSDEVNRVLIAVIIFGIVLIGLECYHVRTHGKIMQKIEKTEKKVDFRYFNTTKSLEYIHNIEIDTKTGAIKPTRRKVSNP